MVTVSYDVRTVRLRVPVLVMRRALADPSDRAAPAGTLTSRTTAASAASAEVRRQGFVDAALALRSGAGV